MNVAKVAIALPREVLARAKREVRAGRAKSLSAFVSEAIDERLRRDELARLLDLMDAEHGPPAKTAKQWASRVVSRARSL
jgi:Arc/MetJ-type ribon-helix-helix transcriptional regulator